jgi:hypothetical protein
MVEVKDKFMFEFMTYGYSGILNALVNLGLNMPLVARAAALDMKPKIREMLKQVLGGNTPKTVKDVADITIPFLCNTFGLEIEVAFPQENLARCKMKNCINRPLAEQSLAQGNEGCLLCLGAFMASVTLSAFGVAEIDQFRGKAKSDHCVFEIVFRE